MKLYFKYLSLHLRAQMQYRTSFLLLAAGQFFMPFMVFAGMAVLFQRFGSLQGWSFHEAAICFAVINLSFALSECFARGFDNFSVLVAGGDFDRVLARPRGTVIQVLGSQFEFTRVGRMLQGFIVLGWAVSGLPEVWSGPKLLAITLMTLCGAVVFTGIYMLAATLCFWTVQGLEIANVFTDGGREMAQYPLVIYEKWVTQFFTFIIPFGCVSYLPLMYVLDKREGGELSMLLIPLAGMLFIVPCWLVWHIGVKHYRSTGS